MEKIKKELFLLIQSVLEDSNCVCDMDLITGESLTEMFAIATKHDTAHIVALGVLNNSLALEEFNPKMQRYIFNAIYRYEKMNYELKQICEALEKAEIPFVPLKGSVIRRFYPEAWMRTSCDIDILVHEKNLKDAVSFLVENLKYIEHEQNSHDVSLISSNGNHIELHYNLMEDNIAGLSSKVLENVWNVVTVKEGYLYHYEMPDDMFYFYHIAHMAKHFENGGCGIRPFIDLWILDRIQEADIKKRNILLEQGDLLQFANVVRKLSQVWFSNEQHDSISQQMEDYILRGGVYGNNENRIMVQQQKKGGRIKYALSKIFVSYEVIKFHYPILQKYKWLTPFMEVRRWFKIIFEGHAKRTLNELKYNQAISSDKAEITKNFLKNIGL